MVRLFNFLCFALVINESILQMRAIKHSQKRFSILFVLSKYIMYKLQIGMNLRVLLAIACVWFKMLFPLYQPETVSCGV